MKIVNPIEAIVAAKDIDTLVVDDSGVTVAGRGRLSSAHGKNFNPRVGVEVELEEVISSVGPIVAAEDVEIVLKGYRRVERSGTWRVSFVGLQRLNQMPCIWVFDDVLLRASDNGVRIEEVRVEARLVCLVATLHFTN